MTGRDTRLDSDSLDGASIITADEGYRNATLLKFRNDDLGVWTERFGEPKESDDSVIMARLKTMRPVPRRS